MDTYENGICHEESKSPKIEVFKCECKGDGKFFQILKNISMVPFYMLLLAIK